jgi:hypothetical protein
MILPISHRLPLKRPRRQRPRPIDTLAQLKGRNRSAAWVWAALLEMAMVAGSPVVTPTRLTLSKISGIPRLQTISDGLTALHDAGWIECIHIPKQDEAGHHVTLLRVIIRKERFSFYTGKSTVCNEKRSTGKQRKSFSDSLKREGATTPRSRVVVTPSNGTEKCLHKPVCESEKASLNADGVPDVVAAMQASLSANHAERKK